MFQTSFQYSGRETKAKYVYLKYEQILTGSILDVGADACHLKQHLPSTTSYVGIGLGNNVDRVVNLEKEKIPFKDNNFDCVLCFDVLEHLENIHEIFDELCRVTKRYVIISLPNPHKVFFEYLKSGNYSSNQTLKFYGLPTTKPQDRHKWFFCAEEAEAFVLSKANQNKMRVLQIDFQNENPQKISLFEKLLFSLIQKKYPNFGLANKNIFLGTLWAVLEKTS